MKISIIIFLLVMSQVSYSQWEAIHPYDPNSIFQSIATSGNNVFAGSTTSGVIYSSDKGLNWINRSLGTDSKPLNVRSIVISRNNVYVATADSGIFLSTDMGVRWEKKIKGLPQLSVRRLAANDDYVFACFDNEIFYTSDNGDNWESTNILPENILISSIAIKDVHIYIGTRGGGIYYSSDMGISWEVKKEELTDKADSTVYSIDIEGENIVAGTEKGIFLSTDSGENWIRKFPFGKAVAVKFNNNKIYAGFYSYPMDIQISSDMGDTWESKTNGILFKSTAMNGEKEYWGKNILSLAVIDKNIIVGTEYDGILVSIDEGEYFEGKTFNDKNANLLLLSGENIFISSDRPNSFQAWGGGIYRSTNMGNSWKAVGFQGRYHSIWSMTFQGDTLWVLDYYKGLYYSTDLGESWQSKEVTGSSGGLRKLIINGNNWAIATVTNGVILSTDSGISWEIKNDGFGTGIYSVAIDGDNIFAGTGGTHGGKGVFFSSDLGNTWVQKGLDDLYIYDIQVSGNYVFAGTNDGFYLSHDYGETWELKFKDNISINIKTIKLHESNLYISAFGQYAANKLYISSDMGETWHSRDTTIAGSSGIFSYGNYIFEDLEFRGEYVYTVVKPTSMIFKAKLVDLLNTTSIKENHTKNQSIILYPNPASDFITLNIQTSEVSKTSEVSAVQIFDMLGLEVAQTPSSVNNMINTQTGASELLRINVSHLPTGVYFIRIGNIIEKFVKY
ncbi:MAG: T9SS type A sorting domain-containing protein [Candidatus Kapabacteria bacterium]|nr:T9SS type A sorting domain-containing protein [Ignavibacteriota bacterium]MCW5886034.1 T9SS type A sorting domain-containing protein [Candidatus Kapabacteria bacterium]